MCTINVNVVRGRSYESFSTQKFVIRKFYSMKISISIVAYETLLNQVNLLIEHKPCAFDFISMEM